jgi:hypothetical protein
MYRKLRECTLCPPVFLLPENHKKLWEFHKKLWEFHKKLWEFTLKTRPITITTGKLARLYQALFAVFFISKQYYTSFMRFDKRTRRAPPKRLKYSEYSEFSKSEIVEEIKFFKISRSKALEKTLKTF